MPGQPATPFTTVRVELEPFDDPRAQDHYANMVGVGHTQFDIVLLFGQIFPKQVSGEQEKASLAPRLRVTLPPSVAADLIAKIRDQLGQRESLMEHIDREEAGHGRE